MVGGIRFRRRFFIWGLWLVSFSFFFFLVFVLGFFLRGGKEGRGGEGKGGEKTTIEEGRGTRGEGGGERVYEEEGEEEEEEMEKDEKAKLNPVNDNNR